MHVSQIRWRVILFRTPCTKRCTCMSSAVCLVISLKLISLPKVYVNVPIIKYVYSHAIRTCRKIREHKLHNIFSNRDRWQLIKFSG